MLIYLSLIDTKGGNHKFEELYIKYRQSMVYVASSILKDEHLAEDAVHMAFIKIAKNMNKIDSIDCPKTKSFIFIIIKRVAIDLYRKKQRENFTSIEDYYLHTDLDDINIYSNEDNDSDVIIMDAMMKLPEIYREIILLKFSHDYSNKEIAQILNISIDSVYKRIQRSKKKLQDILTDERGN